MSTHPGVTAFLYTLMRDLVPPGRVRKIIDDVSSATEETQFSSPELAALAHRYAHVLMTGEEEEPEREEEEDRVVAVEMRKYGEDGRVLSGRDGELSPAMVGWLDRFSERIIMHPMFVSAVNEAAESGMVLNERTAELVYARAQELEEAAAATRAVDAPADGEEVPGG